LAGDAVFSFSAKPITMATRVGLLAIALGLLYMLFIFVQYFRGGVVEGWASLICVVLVLGGLQLAFLGILGQYLARIFEEVKGRPTYLFKQTPHDEERVSSPKAPEGDPSGGI
jgi:dolichol-phosphate mannosyltransferase